MVGIENDDSREETFEDEILRTRLDRDQEEAARDAHAPVPAHDGENAAATELHDEGYEGWLPPRVLFTTGEILVALLVWGICTPVAAFLLDYAGKLSELPDPLVGHDIASALLFGTICGLYVLLRLRGRRMAWQEHGYIFPTRIGSPERGDNVLKRSLKPLAAEIGDSTLDFRKLRRSHSTFYAVLNVHPRVAQMSMGHSTFDTTMKYYTGVPADLQRQAAQALGELLSGPPDESVEDSDLAALPTDPEELDMLEAQLTQKLLQIRELKEQIRQNSD